MGSVVLPLAALGYFYGPALVIYYRVKTTSKSDASFGRVPEPLSTANVAPSSQKLTVFGVELQVPWGGEPQIKQWQKMERMQFADGQFVMLLDPSTMVDRIKILAETSPGHDAEVVFGKEAMRSNYAFLNAMLNVTPKHISLWMPRVQLVRNSVLLMLKGAELTGTQTGLFRFGNETVRGFQKGDPAKSPAVVLDAFDDADREYLIIVGRTSGTNGLVKQADINLILSTLKPMRATTN